MASRYTQDLEISNVFNAVTLAADRTSSTFSVRGYNQLTVFISYTEAGGAITVLNLKAEVTHPRDNSTWYFVTEEDTSSPPTVGIDHNGRAYDLLAAATDPTSETVNFAISMPISGDLCRLTLDQTNGTATDLVTAHVLLSNQ